EQAVAQADAQLQKTLNPYTAQDLASAQAAVDQSQAQLTSAELSLGDTRLVAPVDGVIADMQVATGALVGPSTVLMTLVPPQLELSVNVEESQLRNVAVNQQVQLQVTAFPDQPFTGTVIAISPIVDAKTRTAKIRIAPTDPSGQLRGGMSTSVSIQTQTATDAIVIPQGALRQRNGQQIVFTAEAGVTRMNVVRTGVANIAEVQILEGIQPGDQVILPGSIDLTDGLAVAVAPPPTAAIQP